MPNSPLNTVQTVSIDEAGEIARFEISRTWAPAYTIGLNIAGEATADYAVDIGGINAEDTEPTWFEDEVTYDATDEVRDSWVQVEEWVRIRVTGPAAAGTEATLYVARGE